MLTQNKPLIVHVVISLDTGGLERFVIDLIRTTSINYNFILVSLERSGVLADSCKDIEIISLDMPPGFHIKTFFKLADIMRKNKAVLVHTHNEKAQLYGSIAGKLAGVPVIHTKHGKNQTDFRTQLRNKFASLFCDVIVGVSSDASEQCIKDEKICKNKVITILNGIDTEQFKPDCSTSTIRSEFNIPLGIPVIGTVARLAPVKDQSSLLEACDILKQKGIIFILLIVGDGQLRQQLEAQVTASGLNDTVVFTGMRNDIPALMNAMDIFALSSLSEGISLTLLEAMACELPIVATAVGGNPEVVIDGVTGFLVPPGSPGLMSDKFEYILNSHGLGARLGKSGRNRVLDHFSLRTCADKYIDLYTTLMEIS